MTRVVADTNIIISSVFWRGHPFEVIKRGVSGKCQLVTSAQILDEVARKLRGKFGFPEEGIQQLMDLLLTHCQVVDPTSTFDVVRDRTDNKIVECAVDGDAEFIVTGDNDLLELKEFRGIRIVTAKAFLQQFRQ